MGVSRLAVYAAVLVAVLGAWQWWNAVDVKDFYAGKRIILTGTSQGLGREMAIQLAQLGARLVVSARRENKLAETVRECQRYTPDVHMVVGDMGKEADCERMVETAVDRLGGVDILILNAAYTPPPEWFFTDENVTEKFQNAFRVNVMQAVYLVRSALPHLNASHGNIVAISSGSGILGIPKVSAYGTSKHALQGFFKSLQQEFVMTGVPVSITIMPLPLILTEKAQTNWRPNGDGLGLTVEEGAARVISGISKEQLWCTVDWGSYLVLHLYSLWPQLFDAVIRVHVYFTSKEFANVTRII